MPLDTKSFDMQRTLPLSQDRLWEVLIDPKHREKWGGPDAETVLIVDKADVRVGGIDRHRCGPADAPEFIIETRWYHLEQPQRAVFTETLLVEENSIFTSLITYLVSSDDGWSKLDITVAVSSFTGPEALGEVKAGWEGGLASLQSYASSLVQPT